MALSNFLRHTAGAAMFGALAATLSVAAPQSAQAIAPVEDTFVTYQFTGQCLDCYLFEATIGPLGGPALPQEGIGTATLVLKNFSGGTFDFQNFVSFSYQSIILSYDSTAPGETLISADGTIPGNEGGPGNVFLQFRNENTEMLTTFEAFSFLFSFFDPLDEVIVELLIQNWCIGNALITCQQDNNDFGREYTLELVTGEAVPEPATLALLGAGLLGLGAIRRRRRG